MNSFSFIFLKVVPYVLVEVNGSNMIMYWKVTSENVLNDIDTNEKELFFHQ